MEWIKKYERALLDMKSENEKIDIRKIIEKHMPKNLYNYGSFESEYWKDNVFNGRLYLAPASSFNDPFDCMANFDYKRVMKSGDLHNHLINCFGELIDGIPEEKIREAIFDKMQQNIYVHCFSETWDSLLMWAHYANNYNGYCIRYSTNLIRNNIKDYIYPVLYMDKYVDITNQLIKINKYSGMIAYLAKAKEWSYEKEWRIVLNNQVNNIYLKRSIDAIFLGSKCSKEVKEEIKKWAMEKEKNVFLIKPAKTKYKLEYIQLVKGKS